MQERGVKLVLEPEDEPTTDSDVFYNTDMVVNRDITVACLSIFQEQADRTLRVCDALAASGVRGLRYVEEVDGLKEVLVNDIREHAVGNIRENVALNELDDEPLTVTQKDANLLLTENFHGIDYVDIDPFGSPAPYLDSTARALTHNGAAGFTATDLGPLYGSYPKVCMRRYGSTPLKQPFGHEIGLRILIKEIFRAFSRYDYAFTPLLSWHEQHYSRVFGSVEESKKQCNRMLEDIGHLSFCSTCRWRAFGRTGTCPSCGEQTRTAGELWTGRLAEPTFAERVKQQLHAAGYDGAATLVTLVEDEAELRTPFYDTHELASVNEVQAPRRDELIERLRQEGYRAEATHFSAQGIRTDAPIEAVEEVFRTD